MSAVVELDRVSFRRDGRLILDEVSAVLDPGDFVALVGPNGAGKTTLLHLILGLLRPDSGRISLFGGSAGQGLGQVGYVPQHGRFDRNFPMTVRAMVAQACLPPGWQPARKASAAVVAVVDEALLRCGLADLAERRLDALSGGEMQRALIARALATRPHLLVLDEPTASIDPSGQESLFDLLAELNQGMTVLVVSHDLGLTSRYARRVWCLNRCLHVHDTVDLTAEALARLYGYPVRLVDHRSDHPELPS